ncbi:MAG: TonB-dependent siderophore receptor [Opitutales bacterium]
MKNTQTRILASAFVLTLGLQASLLAQTAPASPSTATAEDQNVVKLETFTVNTDKDNGYTAVDSLAGGRQAAPIRVTPASMSSLTSAFISDLGLTNVQDALKWSLDTVPTSDRSGFSGGSGGGVFNFWSVSIRGDAHVQGGNPPTKNYFPLFVISDTYNVDRIEFDHGPNSILFGIGDIGGAMTSYTKTARFDKNFDKLAASVDSYGGYRGTIDVNQSVGNFALRLNAVAANEKGWRDGDNHKKLGADLAGTFKFNDDKSHVRFEVEGWKEEKSIYGATVQDNASLWDGKTSAATWGAQPANTGANPQSTPGAPGVTGIANWGLNPYNLYIPGIGSMNWAAGIRSMGTNDIAWGGYLRPYSFSYSGATVMALPSKEFTISPKDATVKPEDINMTLTFDHRINDNMDFEVTGYSYVDDAKAINFEGANNVAYDLNKQLPNGTTNPNFGKLYSDYFLDKQIQDHTVNEVRGQFSYHFDANVMNVPVKQLFSISAGKQNTKLITHQYQAVDTTLNPANWNGGQWTQNMVWGRVYWDNPQQGFNLPSNHYAYIPLPFNWFDNESHQDIKYYGVFSQTRLWDDRLNISLGARHDAYDNSVLSLRGGPNTPVLSSGSGNTYSAGFVGYVTEWLGIVGNVSDNYQPAAGGNAPSLYGKTFGPSFGKGQSAGLRASTKDGKYYASLSWYKDTSQDVIGGDHPDFQGIWNDYFAAGGTSTNIGPAGAVTGSQSSGYHANMSYNDTYDVEYKGVELELTANPTKNIRLQLHYSAPKGKRTNDGPDGVSYFAQNLATWQASAGANNAASQKLASDLATAKTNFATWAVPTLAGGVVKDMWNVFATYSFTEDTLKGLEVGMGAEETGARQIDQVNRTTSFTTYALLLRYSKSFAAMDHKIHSVFQLNVDNLFGNNTLVFQNYNGSTPMDYNFIPPRKFTLSASFEF